MAWCFFKPSLSIAAVTRWSRGLSLMSMRYHGAGSAGKFRGIKRPPAPQRHRDQRGERARHVVERIAADETAKRIAVIVGAVSVTISMPTGFRRQGHAVSELQINSVTQPIKKPVKPVTRIDQNRPDRRRRQP